MLPPPLEEMIQLPEPIKEVNEMLPIPLNSYHYDEDEDLPQPDSINHTKHTEDWMNVRMLLRTKPRSGTHVKRTGINKRTIGRCRVTTEKKQLYRHKSRDVVHVLIYVYGPPNGPPWSKERSTKMDRYRDHLGKVYKDTHSCT